jgi:hypothetical protein
MESGDKSLSVTYGAFSCTLAGYADPVPILRAVAAQIRDLAEHEPDFGTIPGQVEVRGALFGAEPRATANDPELAREALTATREVLDTLAYPETEAARAAPRPRLVEEDDDELALERLLARTDQAFEGPEIQRRQETIGHLRVAVEETRAEANYPHADPDPAAPYRDALAAMVWPSRPVPGPVRTERPRPDLPRAEAPVRPDGPPVTPQRVTVTPPTPLPDQAGFPDWASARGAVQPAEVLEAAAAFLVDRGQEGFTRAHLMQLAGMVLPDDRPAREANYRAFGQLLREERLTRADGGTCALGPTSRYAPAAAGD